MTPERIANWIKGNGLSTAKVASSMLRVLRQSTTLDTEAFGSQINRYWYTPEEPFVVLDEWQIAIDNAISSCEA